MKALARLPVGAALVLAAGFGSAQIANASVATVTAPASSAISIAAGAPCIVTGYSLHAEEEMAADSITSDQVESVVHSTCSKARKQSNGTFKYTNGKITVIANSNGYIVTVWRN